MDSAFKKITGKTKSEFDAAAKAENDRYMRTHTNPMKSAVEKRWLSGLELAKQIIEEFEKYDPIPTSKDEWRNDAEFIAMYVAALKYVERFG